MAVERLLLVVLLAALAIGCWMVLRPFVSAMLWAMILVFCSWPIYAQLRRTPAGSVGAALCMVAGFACVIALPIAMVAPGGATDFRYLNLWLQTILAAGLPSAPHWVYAIPLLGTTLGDLWNSWAADLSAMAAFFRPYLGALAEGGLHLLLGIASGAVVILLALFISFFLFLGGDIIRVRLRALARRIAQDAGDRMLTTVGRTVRGTVYAILGTALVQSLLTFAGLAIAGVPRAPLLAMLAGFLSLLPIGAPLVWVPAAIWLLVSGATAHGIFLAIYGAVSITGADHVIRPWMISRGSRLPFVLTVLGVLGGVIAFGLLGIFLGPMLLGAGFALVNEYATGDGTPKPEPPRPA
jgi:predicted PurR-regulated permease PerM